MNQLSVRCTVPTMKVLKIIAFLIITLGSSCGGAIGNVDRYTYNISIHKLKSSLDSVIHSDSRYTSSEIDSVYKVRDEKNMYYILIIHNNEKLVFGFEPISIGNKSMIALIYAAPLGEVLELPVHRSFFEKRKYSAIFKKEFLEKIKEKIL